MTAQLLRRATSLFARALDVPQHERGAFLDAACSESALRAEVESLLEYDRRFECGAHDEGFLKSPLVRTAEQVLRVQEALESLDPVDRDVLVLRHVEQLGRSETAQVLGITQQDGAKRYFRAVKALKNALATMPAGRDGT
jgi:RNA polymerase sigma factor (sigma-70 family)